MLVAPLAIFSEFSMRCLDSNKSSTRQDLVLYYKDGFNATSNQIRRLWSQAYQRPFLPAESKDFMNIVASALDKKKLSQTFKTVSSRLLGKIQYANESVTLPKLLLESAPRPFNVLCCGTSVTAIPYAQTLIIGDVSQRVVENSRLKGYGTGHHYKLEEESLCHN
jgi:hypothetical protein